MDAKKINNVIEIIVNILNKADKKNRCRCKKSRR